jgi:hypothetical protein
MSGLWQLPNQKRRPDGEAPLFKNHSTGSDGNIDSIPAAAAEQGWRITRWTPRQIGMMLGFFSAETPSGIIVHDFRAMRNQAGAVWIGIPNRPLIDSDGRVLVNDAGKKSYTPTIEFRDKATERRVLEQVREALRREYPEIFAGFAQ